MSTIVNKLNNSSSIKYINIIDFNSNPYLKKRINSPRSLELINSSGYTFEELCYETFNEFKKNHSEIMSLPNEIQKMRYSFYESRRKEKIKEILELYLYLCENEKFLDINDNNKKNSKQEKNKFNLLKNYNSFNEYEMNKKDLRSFERLKAKSEMDLLKKVEKEIEREIYEKNEIEKEKEHLFKQKKLKEELQKKQIIENRMKIQKEKEKLQKEENEYLLKKEKEKEKFE